MKAFWATILGLFLTAPVYSQVTVTGTGEVAVTPNAARFLVGVSVQDANAGAALKQANASTTKLFAVLDKYKIEKRDIATNSLMLGLSRDTNGKVDGYAANNLVTVTVRDMSVLDNLLGDVVASGANTVRNLQFICTNDEDALNQARNLAVINARNKADLFAKSGGFKIGAVTSLTEDRNLYNSDAFPQMRMAEAGPGKVPTSAGQRVIKVTVQVVYSIAN